jgi:3D (Asp-Asp-Asp) domain-containing protein
MIVATLRACLCLFFVSSLLANPGRASAAKQPKPKAPPAEVVLGIRTTAYTHTESDHLEWQRQTASGTELQFGSVKSAAADWAIFPLGTRFQIPGDPSIYVVDDYGSALVGTATIDLYRPTPESMNEWGTRTVNLKVLEWGSRERSLQILCARASMPEHVKAMAERLASTLGLPASAARPFYGHIASVQPRRRVLPQISRHRMIFVVPN